MVKPAVTSRLVDLKSDMKMVKPIGSSALVRGIHNSGVGDLLKRTLILIKFLVLE
jgi:hypothetical protein